MKIYCMSDIHGCYSALCDALELVIDHLGEPDTKLIFLGDYIHGGEDNIAVLKKIMGLQNIYGHRKVVALLGNHEEMVMSGFSSVNEMLDRKCLAAANMMTLMTRIDIGLNVCRDIMLRATLSLSTQALTRIRAMLGNTAPRIIFLQSSIPTGLARYTDLTKRWWQGMSIPTRFQAIADLTISTLLH